MLGLSCDRCGKSLLIDEDVRYTLKIELVAAWDPPEITAKDLRRDFDAEIRKLIKAMESRDAKSLEEEVAVLRTFDLCPPCRVEFLALPLGASPD